MTRPSRSTPLETQPVSARPGHLADRESASTGAERLAGKYMTFRLADEDYGLAILTVREIIGMMSITRVPRTADFIRGVVNLRGKVIPVVDLRLKFGMPRGETSEQSVIIVVQIRHGDRDVMMGVLVDQVLEVRDVKAHDIEPTPQLGAQDLDTSFILGVGKANERVIFLLDIARVLDEGDADAIARAAA